MHRILPIYKERIAQDANARSHKDVPMSAVDHFAAGKSGRREVKMKKAIMATKIGMTQVFQEDGTLIPVTVLEAGPCVVTQIKTIENDGYEAVQVGYGDAKERITTVDKNGKKEVAHRHGVGKAMKR